MKTRNQSNSEKSERRNSVSEITDYFSKMATKNPGKKDNHANCNAGGKAIANKNKVKDKEDKNTSPTIGPDCNQENLQTTVNDCKDQTEAPHNHDNMQSQEIDWHEEATDNELYSQVNEQDGNASEVCLNT